MDRRRFLQSTALTTAAACVPKLAADDRSSQRQYLRPFNTSLTPAINVDIAGHTFICEFTIGSTAWKVYEDLRTCDGVITFLSASGARSLGKSAEASFSEDSPPYLGLVLKDIGLSA